MASESRHPVWRTAVVIYGAVTASLVLSAVQIAASAIKVFGAYLLPWGVVGLAVGGGTGVLGNDARVRAWYRRLSRWRQLAPAMAVVLVMFGSLALSFGSICSRGQCTYLHVSSGARVLGAASAIAFWVAAVLPMLVRGWRRGRPPSR